jgi:hypothetical protein
LVVTSHPILFRLGCYRSFSHLILFHNNPIASLFCFTRAGSLSIVLYNLITMPRPILESNDLELNSRRQAAREKMQRHRARPKKQPSPAKKASPAKTKRLVVPNPTLPPVLSFELPPPRHRSTPAVNEISEVANCLLNLRQAPVGPRKKPRDLSMERVYCARSRLKKRLGIVLDNLETTLVALKDSGFQRQKRDGTFKTNFNWCFQFDAYTHAVRTLNQNGFKEHETIPHNIPVYTKRLDRVRFTPRDAMLEKFGGTADQKEMQAAAWDLVAQLIQAIPPLKEWAGDDWKVQFSMMTSKKHRVKPHRDSADICPQYSICLGDYSGGDLLTWRELHQKDPSPNLATDVRRKLVRFDGRLQHSVSKWSGKYRINIALYKAYDARWTKEVDIQPVPLLVMDFNHQARSK